MARSKRATPRRRTQEERSAETRALLLDTTVKCLAELGYQKTTSQVVADRAGLSRGAQLHHFGSKAQLVTAAMEHLFAVMREQLTSVYETMPRDGDFTAGAIDALWKVMSGPVGYAYIELACAARTDPELREHIVALTRRMDSQVDETFRDLFGDMSSGIPAAVMWTALFALLEGLAFERVVRPDDPLIEQVLTTLKQAAAMLMPPRV